MCGGALGTVDVRQLVRPADATRIAIGFTHTLMTLVFEVLVMVHVLHGLVHMHHHGTQFYFGSTDEPEREWESLRMRLTKRGLLWKTLEDLRAWYEADTETVRVWVDGVPEPKLEPPKIEPPKFELSQLELEKEFEPRRWEK